MSRFSGTTINPNAEREPSLPLYVAGVIGQGAALYAVTSYFFTIPFAVGLVLFTVFAARVSFQWARQPGIENRLLPGACALGVFFIVVQMLASRFGTLLPLQVVLSGNDLSVILSLVLTAAVATFVWLSEIAVVFSCVWSIAIIGLAATTNLNVLVILCFCIYLAAALFQLIHHSTLRQAAGRTTVQVTSGPLLAQQLKTAGILWIATLVLGVVIAIPLQMIGRNMSLTSILEKLKVSPQQQRRNAGKLKLVFDRPNEFTVGLGPVTDDDTLVYKVHANQTYYWRLRTFSVSEGNTWLPFGDDTTGTDIEPSETSGGKATFALPGGLEGKRKKTEHVTASVEPVATVRAMPHIAEPTRVRVNVRGVRKLIDGTIGVSRSFGDLGSTVGPYELEADVSTATPEDLNKASKDYPPEILRRYLQEPNPGMLDALAREAIGTTANPYDQAEAIRKFVANRCTYTYDALPVPPGRNPAEWFLNESKAGYCDLYATSVTLLCRAAGIPARIVTGFNAGEIDAETKDTYNLRERNRHAWCEVYFVGYGWVPFDATAITTDATVAPVATPPSKQTKRTTFQIGPAALAAVGVVGLIAVGAGELLRRRVRGTARKTVSVHDQVARHLASLYRSALKALTRQGVPRRRSMTTGEHTVAIRKALGEEGASAYQTLARLCDLVLFDQVQLGEADLAVGQEAHRRLLSALQERKRS